MQVELELQLVLKQAGQLANRQAMPHGQAMKADERFAPRIEHGPGDIDTADGIRPIKHDESLAVLGTGLHRFAHRRFVRVEPRANILNVEDDRVDGFEHRSRWPARLSIQAKDL